MSKKSARTRSKPIIRVKKEKGEVIDQVPFDNTHEAVENTMRLYPNIKRMDINSLVCRVDKNETYKGFYWISQPPKDLPDEEWRLVILPHVTGIKVSNKGRVEFANKRRTFGCKEGKYMTIQHGRKNYKVHFLVCVAFHRNKHPTFIGDPDISVDHISHTENDNRAENVRWATSREQHANFRHSTQYVAYRISDGVQLNKFTDTNDIADHFGLKPARIRDIISGKVKRSKLLPDVRFEKVSNDIEQNTADIFTDLTQESEKAKVSTSRRTVSAFKKSTNEKIKDFRTLEQIAKHFSVGLQTVKHIFAGRTKNSRALPDIRFKTIQDETVGN